MSKNLIHLTLLTILIGCNSNQDRMDLINIKSGLELPKSFEVIRNESIDDGSFDGDFSIYIELKFDDENFQILVANLEKVMPSEEWVKVEGGYRFDSNDIDEPTIIEIDSKKRFLFFKMHHL